jgi:hypothetical protein
MAEFRFQEMFPHGADATPYRKLDGAWVGRDTFRGAPVLTIDAAALTRLAFEAVRDVSHLFRPGHLAQLRTILEDPEASANDRFVALNMLRNACISAGMVLPSCQDTGTAIVIGKKGQCVWTSADDEQALARGIYDVYQETNLRYSQLAPLATFEEKNTGTNLPAQIDLYATDGDEYRFLFVTKGGGSANKSFLYQETPALLNEKALLAFLDQKIRTLGTGAVPALPPGDRHRRHVGGDEPEDGEARIVPRPRRPPDARQRARARDPRSCARGHRLEDDAEDGHRRAVRRQVLLPRRARDPPPSARGEPARRHRRLVLRRSPGEGEDHARRRLPGAARDGPGQVRARGRRGEALGRRGRDRPAPAHGGDPCDALAPSDQDAPRAHRPDGGRPRPGAREAPRAPRAR